MNTPDPLQKEQAYSSQGWIIVEGAREHNLKDITVYIPRDRFVVVTGVSGSGKSSLVFDILFAEGQRRFLACLNPYVRQFIKELPRPEVERIRGLPPVVSIEQRTSQGGGKSTVATVTEIYHFLRLLYAKLGVPWCPNCKIPLQSRSFEQLYNDLLSLTNQLGHLKILAPLVRGRKGFHYQVFEQALRRGINEFRVDGKFIKIESKPPSLARYREHYIEAVLGTIASESFIEVNELNTRNLIKEALSLGEGMIFAVDKYNENHFFSIKSTCPKCDLSIPPLEPKLFSYNSPAGWCPECRGFGEKFFLPEGVDRGARADEIEESWYEWAEGSRQICEACGGTRLNPIARSVHLKLGGWSNEWTIPQICLLSAKEALELFDKVKLEGYEKLIAQDIIPEIIERLSFMCEVGLGYLQLQRSIPSLSGGEAQRVRLAAQLGSNLTGTLYILDEPTIGLHPRDCERLLHTIRRLRQRGNSVIVVEHDENTIRQADYIIDLGPRAGAAGGQVVAAGPLEEILQNEDSITAHCLRSPLKHPLRGFRRNVSFTPKSKTTSIKKNKNSVEWLILEGASLHNLKNLTVAIPLRRLVVVTGVSGSGKSTLVRECLLPAIKAALYNEPPPPKVGRIIKGIESIKSVHVVDQSPIGRTPRSVPATYVKVFDLIRDLYAQLPESKLRGYGPSRFSFNTPEGRCSECEGMGAIKIEMSFLPSAYVPCEKCQGKRFSPQTLEIKFQGKNIAEVLDLTVDEAREFFIHQPRIRRILDIIAETGLGYLRLGQPSPTLSGGEAQRIKLLRHLIGSQTPPKLTGQLKATTLFLLEEPTIGLHTKDVELLIMILHKLVDLGQSVVVIEHNIDIWAEADWIIDLGPEGGNAGGYIVAEGPPEKIIKSKNSHTAAYLRSALS